nr:immunoglobulin heavy chain junction region [Mus musculus]
CARIYYGNYVSLAYW